MSKAVKKWIQRLEDRKKRLDESRKRKQQQKSLLTKAKDKVSELREKISAQKSEDAKKGSPQAIKMIKKYEGFRDRPYNDPAGHATIGYGTLLHYGPVNQEDINKWGTISEKKATQLLVEDVTDFEYELRRLVKVKLNQNQFDALLDWIYNLGPSHLAKSTLLRHLNSGKYELVPAEIKRWVYAEGVKLPGLVKRREEEAQLFAKPVR